MYLPNPLLEILIDEEWINIYDLVDLDDIEKNHSRWSTGFIKQVKSYRKQLGKNPNLKIDPDKFWNTRNF